MWYLPPSEQNPMRTIAKLFTHGRSQAVRLPKEFRFKGKEVRISRIGDRVILEPISEIRPMPWDQIDQLGDMPFMPEGRDQPAMPADRVVFDE
jgi:antitoxin VapB